MIVREADPGKPGWLRARIDGVPKPIPDEVPLIVGDAVHNLRTSLDYFACAAVAVVTTDTAFPIQRKSPENLSNWKSLVPHKLKDASSTLLQAVKDLEPRPAGKHEFLWTVNELDNTDKHQLVLPVVIDNTSFTHDLAAAMLANAPDWVSHDPLFVSLKPAYEPIEDGTVLYRGPEAHFSKPMAFAFAVAFGDPHTIRRQMLIPQLPDLVDEVEALLRGLSMLA